MAPSPLSLFLFKFELVSIGVPSAGWLACFDFFFGLLDVGVAGDAGDASVAGVVGITGDTGVAGDAGVTRVAGIVGTTGDTGVAGDAGIAGVVGITGDASVAGDVGVTRVAGVVGTIGDTGMAGDAGVAGTADVPCFVVDFWDGGAFVCFWGGLVLLVSPCFGDPFLLRVTSVQPSWSLALGWAMTRALSLRLFAGGGGGCCGCCGCCCIFGAFSIQGAKLGYVPNLFTRHALGASSLHHHHHLPVSAD